MKFKSFTFTNRRTYLLVLHNTKISIKIHFYMFRFVNTIMELVLGPN